MPRVTYMTGAVPAALPRRVLVAQPAGDDAWADAVARLARSHRMRLAAPDPSRPWLSPTPRDETSREPI